MSRWHITAHRCPPLEILDRFSKINSEIQKDGRSGCKKDVRITERFLTTTIINVCCACVEALPEETINRSACE